MTSAIPLLFAQVQSFPGVPAPDSGTDIMVLLGGIVGIFVLLIIFFWLIPAWLARTSNSCKSMYLTSCWLMLHVDLWDQNCVQS